MKATSHEELELQKNRLEILKMSGKNLLVEETSDSDVNKYLWQYELEHYKKMRRREKFYFVGAICGVMSLLLTISLNYSVLLQTFLKLL